MATRKESAKRDPLSEDGGANHAVPISISVPSGLVSQIDGRAAQLNLSRSQYLVALAIHGLKKKGILTLHPQDEEASPA